MGLVPVAGPNPHDHEARPGSEATTGTILADTIYRGCMGMLILIVLAAIALFFILSAVISTGDSSRPRMAAASSSRVRS